jgi:hypothetical protein
MYKRDFFLRDISLCCVFVCVYLYLCSILEATRQFGFRARRNDAHKAT